MTLKVSKNVVTAKNARRDFEKELIKEVGGDKIWILNGGNGGTYFLGTYKHHRLFSNVENYWYFDQHEHDYCYYDSYTELKQAIDTSEG